MNQIHTKLKNIEQITQNHLDLLREVYEKTKKVINGKREIMYSDIINLMVRKQYTGDVFNQIIIWCTYNIKQGNIFVKFD